MTACVAELTGVVCGPLSDKYVRPVRGVGGVRTEAFSKWRAKFLETFDLLTNNYQHTNHTILE
jgi:hypothetical protein